MTNETKPEAKPTPHGRFQRWLDLVMAQSKKPEQVEPPQTYDHPEDVSPPDPD